ncbi:tetraspanin-19 isoform 4-T4 [Liasis olivaceus]
MKKRRNKLFILKFFLNIFIGVFLHLFLCYNNQSIYRRIFSDNYCFSCATCEWFCNYFYWPLGMLRKCSRNPTHMGFLILIIIIQAAVIVLLYTGKDMINLRWKAKMDQLISNYGNKHLIETEQWNILDVFQRMLHCCGQHNFTDWKVNEHKEHVDQIPCSCTTLNTMKWFCDPVQDAIYTRGCAKDIRIWYEENIWLLISINTGLLLVEVFQLVAAASLFTIMRKNVILPTN